MAADRWTEESQARAADGFSEAGLTGRVVDIHLADGTRLDAARVKTVSRGLIQVTHKDRIKYLNPDHVVMIELG